MFSFPKQIMFTTFDITNRGFVNVIQYRKGEINLFYLVSFSSLFRGCFYLALEALGVNPSEVTIPDLEAFDKSTFVNYM
jgi:hypothetical protein